ncbi:MAG: hypothetical protein WC046_09990, partial [Candidatus Bathyarchaeia archaeon]
QLKQYFFNSKGRLCSFQRKLEKSNDSIEALTSGLTELENLESFIDDTYTTLNKPIKCAL